ncbi:MAG: hypothetical protein KIT73_01720 [Burkholderiales bacterium]|nr:hypothetical protein [Burkholderiales bacterium]
MRIPSMLSSVAIACGFAFAVHAADASPPKRASAARATLQTAPQPDLPLKNPQRAGPQRPVSGADKLLGAPMQADLVPSAFFNAQHLPEGFPGIGFCDPNPAGGTPNKIRFRLTNQGASPAAASVVRVDFVGGGSVSVNAPALMPGAETSGAVNIPQGCYPPGFSSACQFTIHADGNAQVAESVESNNAVQSLCVQPAG